VDGDDVVIGEFKTFRGWD